MVGKRNARYIVNERREMVSTMLDQCMPTREICKELKISQPTLSRDIHAIKKVAQKFFYGLAKENMMFEYMKLIRNIDMIARECWNIVNDKSNKSTQKDKINALKLTLDAEQSRHDILTQAPTLLEVRELDEKLQKATNKKKKKLLPDNIN
jgi:hypothetical protein